MNSSFNKGSIWRIWDLQVQTILDDGYVSLVDYSDDLKKADKVLWETFTKKVGGEENALLFDSKSYFGDINIDEDLRYHNYVSNLFAFIETYNPNLGLVAFTDHNYAHPKLLDCLYNFSKNASCKALCGVEVNASGVHMLIYFEKPPFKKSTFAEGIRAFLDTIGVHQPKTNDVLTVCPKSVTDVIDIARGEDCVYIFPHCNSNNGLFQERGKTDRTHLADTFNHQEVILLQASTKESATKTNTYIDGKKQSFLAKHIFTISADSRGLKDIGICDSKGNYTWVKADPTFKGLKQLLIEHQRIELEAEPKLSKRVRENKTKFIRSLSINKVKGVGMKDVWFDNFHLELNSGLIAIIGNKGSGKSAIADILGLCGNTYQDPANFSFLDSKKFRKARPVNLSERFEATITWEDNTVLSKILNQNPDKNLPERVKYIPQNFLEKVCADVDSNQFENELKQIIYHHTPQEKRLEKGSLDELIDHKSNLINGEIQVLKAQLSNLNQEIAFSENKATKQYRTAIENQIQLKKDELKAHDTTLPVKPLITESTENEEEVIKLAELRALQEEIEGEIKLERKNKSKLFIESEELSQVAKHFANLREQFLKQLLETSAQVVILKKNGIKIEDVFSFTINTKPIDDKLEEKSIAIANIDVTLDITKEGSKTFIVDKLIKDITAGQEDLDKPAKEQQKYLTAQKAWTEKKDEIEGEKSKEGTLNYYLNQIEYLDNKLGAELEKLYSERLAILKELYSKKQELTVIRKELFQPVSQFIDEFKDLKSKYDVKFDVTFELKNFSEGFFGFIHQSKIGTFSGKDEGYKRLSDIVEKINFDTEEGFLSFTSELLDALKNDKRTDPSIPVEITTQLKSNRNLNELYDYLFSYDYLQPIYNLKLGEKTLQELSPGERGALLLIFYLVLDSDDIPLIIDQPEENLDNESVYHILVHFIKQAKEKRQIVIVTHNPNLAVVCDADQIIHMQIDKINNNEVGFITGAIENLNINRAVVNVLEGTLPAFNNRDSKYIKTDSNF